jgi:hypothetical protein
MSLHNLAHHVRGKGRGKDSMLVHMTPREVQGLQALAKAKGGTLTINPETGLPEAGFLEDVLPVVAMAAATYFTAGAAAPMLAGTLGTTGAGIVAGAGSGALFGGLGAAMKGGDVGKGALMGGIGGGITGGMGGYDAANVFGVGVPDAATQATQTAGIEAASALNPQAGGFQQVAGNQLIPTEQGNLFLPGGSAQSSVNIGPNIPEQFAQGTASTFAPASSSVAPPPSYYSGLGSGAMDTAKKAATLALPGIGGAMGEKPDEIPGEEEYKSRSTLSPNFQGYVPPRPNPYYRAQYTRYAAGGGLMDAYQAGGPVERMSMMNTAMNPQGGLYPQGMIDKTQYATPTQRPVSSEMVDEAPAYERSSPMLMAGGGIADLGGYSDGGRMLRGPGDGMSDSIPARIGSKQPARLADGEFVVPADVVSHLGNGSTDAGARKLYAMMDKVRRARTGKKKQAPAVNTGRFMPA